jgi:thioredoxin reductase (NADPH)
MNTFDLIIIGSGPAGLSAAIYAARAELNFAVFDRSAVPGGQVQSTYEVDNYPGIPGVSGPELSEKMRAHCDKLGVSFITEDIVNITHDNDLFTVTTSDNNTYTARAVIAATGASHRKLECPGEEELAGMGVSYCATCDGAFFKKRKCAVVGGGDVAFEDAIYLSKLARVVYLIHRRDGYRAAPTLVSQARAVENIEFITDTVVNSINGSDMVESLTLSNVKTGETSNLEVDGVFIATGIIPVNVLFGKLADCDEIGYIKANENCETSCPGLFVAGDLRTKQLRQIVTAAADGANAVTSAIRFLG